MVTFWAMEIWKLHLSQQQFLKGYLFVCLFSQWMENWKKSFHWPRVVDLKLSEVTGWQNSYIQGPETHSLHPITSVDGVQELWVEQQIFSTAFKSPPERPADHKWVAAFKSWLPFWSTFLIMPVLGTIRWHLNWLYPCRHRERPNLSSWLPASASIVTICGVNQQTETNLSSFLPLFVHPFWCMSFRLSRNKNF